MVTFEKLPLRSLAPGGGVALRDGTLHADCESCPVRGQHCGDCMLTALLSSETPAPVTCDVVGPPGSKDPLPAGREDGPFDHHEDRGSGGPLAAVGPEESAPLDRLERAAIGACIRAGLVSAEVANEAVARLGDTAVGTGLPELRRVG